MQYAETLWVGRLGSVLAAPYRSQRFHPTRLSPSPAGQTKSRRVPPNPIWISSPLSEKSRASVPAVIAELGNQTPKSNLEGTCRASAYPTGSIADGSIADGSNTRIAGFHKTDVTPRSIASVTNDGDGSVVAQK